MSETSAPEPTDKDFLEYEERRSRLQPDDFLAALVNIVNRNPEISLGITLTVGGSFISGLLKGRRPWVAEMVEAYGEPAAFASQFGDLWAEQDAAGDVHPDMPVFPGFIHLVDAHLVTGEWRLPTDAGMFWRGRLNEVSGWSLGTLDRSQNG